MDLLLIGDDTSHRILEDSACGGCQNEGICISPIDTEGSLTSLRPSCQCKNTGFIGPHCEIPCSKSCDNGGKCVPASDETNGEETCSCTKAVVDGNPFAGLTCEYGATKSCMILGSDSKHSFCTNGGECNDIVGDNEVHKDCVCVNGYEGPHCEYKSGTTPTFIANAKSAAFQSSNTFMSDTVLYSAMAGICVLIGLLVLSFIVRSRGKRAQEMKKQNDIKRATEELAMVQVNVYDDESSSGTRRGFV